MKRFISFLFAAMLCVGFVGCGESDNSNTGNTDNADDNNDRPLSTVSIVGTWRCASEYELDGDEEYFEVFDEETDDFGVVFYDDNTGISYGTSAKMYLKWSLIDEKLTIRYYYEAYDSGTEQEVDQVVLFVKKLTSNAMELWFDDGADFHMEFKLVRKE
ncbi:MAG: hypothetical protein IKM12_03540 [Alistipes sp.]|nr:hypothetical protein [Alistipes sp.]